MNATFVFNFTAIMPWKFKKRPSNSSKLGILYYVFLDIQIVLMLKCLNRMASILWEFLSVRVQYFKGWNLLRRFFSKKRKRKKRVAVVFRQMLVIFLNFNPYACLTSFPIICLDNNAHSYWRSGDLQGDGTPPIGKVWPLPHPHVDAKIQNSGAQTCESWRSNAW